MIVVLRQAKIEEMEDNNHETTIRSVTKNEKEGGREREVLGNRSIPPGF